MNSLDKLFEIKDAVLEEQRKAEKVLESWGTAVHEEPFGGFILKRHNMTVTQSMEAGLKFFGDGNIEPYKERTSQEKRLSLGNHLLYPYGSLDCWCNFGFTGKLWSIRTKQSVRTVTFNSDGNIYLYKEANKWPKQNGAIAFYEGNYNVKSSKVKLEIFINRTDCIRDINEIVIEADEEAIKLRYDSVSIERDLKTGVVKMNILYKDTKNSELLDVRFVSLGNVLQSGFLSIADVNEQGKVTKAKRVIVDAQGRRKVVVVPSIGKLPAQMTYEQLASDVGRLAEVEYKDLLFEYLSLAHYGEGAITLDFEPILELEKKVLEKLGTVSGELILDGLTKRVVHLIDAWKKELGMGGKTKTLRPLESSQKNIEG